MIAFHIATTQPSKGRFDHPILHRIRFVSLLQYKQGEVQWSTRADTKALDDALRKHTAVGWCTKRFSLPVLATNAMHEIRPNGFRFYEKCRTIDLAERLAFGGDIPRLADAATLVAPGRLFQPELDDDEAKLAIEIDVAIIALLWVRYKGDHDRSFDLQKGIVERMKKQQAPVLYRRGSKWWPYAK